MHEWSQLTSDEVAALNRNVPVILPVGLIEAHGPHLATSVDMDTAEYFARKIAENSGAILLPTMVYGFADEMAEYVGTVGLSADTMVSVVTDLCTRLCSHGFEKIIVLSGHGANKLPSEMAFYRIWQLYPDAQLVYWNYWTEAGVTGISHADKGETEIAMAVGTVSHMDRAVDFKVNKPWYRLRSRHAINPRSGGINGEPTKADLVNGEQTRDHIVQVLSEKVKAIVQQA